MVRFVHPSKADLELPDVLAALGDPIRLRILKTLLDNDDCMSCCQAAPCPKMAKSTISNHFRILREAGLIRTTKQGVENRSVVRIDDLNERFPGLLKTIIKLTKDLD